MQSNFEVRVRLKDVEKREIAVAISLLDDPVEIPDRLVVVED